MARVKVKPHTWGFDIETAGWDTFVVGAACRDDGETIVFRSVDHVADWYKSLPSTDEIVSHFGGGFDFLFLISVTPELEWSASIAGATIVTCRAKGGAQCRDTSRLFPLSLAKWTGRKTSTGLLCKCGKQCGGYCSIAIDMPREQLATLTEYCVNDTRILLETWLSDVERLQADGLDVYNARGRARNTIGGVAWNTAALMAGIDPAEVPDWADYHAGRAGYYGGRCEVGRVYLPSPRPGHRYDVHAMYPWALTLPVPFGKRRSLTGAEAVSAFDSHELGIFGAHVYVPDTDLPPLPHRYAGPTQGRLTRERLLWATGDIHGVWSGVELRHALAHGAKLLSIDTASIWSDSGPVMRSYVEHVYMRRRQAIDEGDERWGAVLKWFANSLSGKLAQRPTVSRLVVRSQADDLGDDWEPCGPPGSRVYAQSAVLRPPSGHTWIAATLTARARVKLHSRLIRHSGRWLYCDTDSTYLLDKDDTDVHESRLGSWGYEGEAHDWQALAPKLYRYRDELGRRHVRARGVPDADWPAFDALAHGETVSSERGVERIRSSGGAFVRRSVTRSFRDARTGRCGTRFIERGGTTRPLRRNADGSYT